MYTALPPEAARKGVLTVLQIVHGYPPRELAGTELATARLADALRARGWRCVVLASTRAPGSEQYSVLEDGHDLIRVVNNHPHRPLGEERDPAIEGIVADTVQRVDPHVIHVQHLAYLSSHLRFGRPAVGTLHDHWPWCAAAGTMLREGSLPCPAPEPSVCASCYARVAQLPGRVEHAAVGLASALSRVVPPDRAHRAWRRLPLGLRARLRGSSVSPGTAEGAVARRASLTATWNALDVRMAPSAFLAAQAEHHGLDEVRVVPNGAPVGPWAPRCGGGPLVHLGSVVRHKGVHLVVEAYRRAFGGHFADPGLEIHGNTSLDPSYAQALDWPLEGPLEPSAVPRLLARASALVMGSLWPENAPLVCLEARRARCPVVAPRIGGIPELVEHGVDGFLYRPGDAEDLADCLRRITALSTALPVREPCSMAEHAERVEAIYLEVMGSSSRTSQHRRTP